MNQTTVVEDKSYFNFSSGFVLAIVANILWGTTFLASKYTLQAWGPFTSAALRFGIATICLLVILKALKKKIEMPETKNQWLGLLLIATSAFGVLYPMQLAGLKFIPSSLSAAIMLISPIAVLGLSRTVLREKLSPLKYVALTFGIVGGGILLFSTNNRLSVDLNSDFFMGTLLTLASAVSLAISAIVTRKYSKEISSASITFWTMAIGFVELTLAAFFFEENVLATITTNSNTLSWLSLFFLAFVCSSFCFYIWNHALSKASPQEIASSMHIKTPTAVLIGVFIAGEELTPRVIIGTGPCDVRCMALTTEEDLGATMNTFQPDLIVEVTGACNRACSGCYAPNVVAKDASEIFAKRPELFLKTDTLNNALSEMSPVGIASIRGGEPTLHPELPSILKMTATCAKEVFLETHARWLMEENFIPYIELLKSIVDNGIIVKISFDKMHGLMAEELQRITHFLNWHDVDFRIAITEPTIADYMATRSLCSFIKDEKIIYQPKAASVDELVKPTVGTINVRGELKATLNHKFNVAEDLIVAYA